MQHLLRDYVQTLETFPLTKASTNLPVSRITSKADLIVADTILARATTGE